MFISSNTKRNTKQMLSPRKTKQMFSRRQMKWMVNPPRWCPLQSAKIFVKNTRLDDVASFPYHGCTISKTGFWMLRFFTHSKGRGSFGKLESIMWSSRGITTKTEVNVYTTRFLISSLLCSSEKMETYKIALSDYTNNS